MWSDRIDQIDRRDRLAIKIYQSDRSRCTIQDLWTAWSDVELQNVTTRTRTIKISRMITKIIDNNRPPLLFIRSTNNCDRPISGSMELVIDRTLQNDSTIDVIRYRSKTRSTRCKKKNGWNSTELCNVQWSTMWSTTRQLAQQSATSQLRCTKAKRWN